MERSLVSPGLAGCGRRQPGWDRPMHFRSATPPPGLAGLSWFPNVPYTPICMHPDPRLRPDSPNKCQHCLFCSRSPQKNSVIVKHHKWFHSECAVITGITSFFKTCPMDSKWPVCCHILGAVHVTCRLGPDSWQAATPKGLFWKHVNQQVELLCCGSSSFNR